MSSTIKSVKVHAPISLVIMVAKPIETALFVHELEGCEFVREDVWIEGKLPVLPLNESDFGESAAAAMAVDSSLSRADFATSLPTSHSTVPEANGRRNAHTDPTKRLGPKILEVDILRHVSPHLNPIPTHLHLRSCRWKGRRRYAPPPVFS